MVGEDGEGNHGPFVQNLSHLHTSLPMAAALGGPMAQGNAIANDI